MGLTIRCKVMCEPTFSGCALILRPVAARPVPQIAVVRRPVLASFKHPTQFIGPAYRITHEGAQATNCETLEIFAFDRLWGTLSFAEPHASLR